VPHSTINHYRYTYTECNDNAFTTASFKELQINTFTGEAFECVNMTAGYLAGFMHEWIINNKQLLALFIQTHNV
jgi:hypothetical protein